ncbi:MAG: competence/damage-inducible protein A [Fimbriimonadaceae bacterium]|nr:competence/damage-inducible protein A [Fimbriimonadaceae bacterium]QYK56739.1 MAG: competence/damage-inducible protein A [Fimbriimonadaceae bacterium]
MRAEIVSVGTELLLGQIVDSNAALAGEVFAECGVVHTNRQTVGDNLPRLVEALRLALSRSDIVLTIGGLGPTEDDITRTGIADALGLELVEDPEVARSLRAFFEGRGLPWVDSQLQQARRPAGSTVVPNPNGTAPGLICPKGDKTVLALPGPRGEFRPMVTGPVREWLLTANPGQTIRSVVLRLVGIGESVVEDRLRDLMHGTDPTVAPYAKTGEVHIRVSAQAATEAEAFARIAPVREEIQSRLGHNVYGEGDSPLEAVLLQELRQRGQTLAVAESCTGGGLGYRLTSIAGLSDVFLGGFLTYSNEAKTRLLGVPKDLIEAHGAVSPECAEAMAEGCRERLDADYALSVTGIAGPGGGSEEKPVGLVYTGLAGPGGARSARNLFRGGRAVVRERAVQAALVNLWEALKESS